MYECSQGSSIPMRHIVGGGVGRFITGKPPPVGVRDIQWNGNLKITGGRTGGGDRVWTHVRPPFVDGHNSLSSEPILLIVGSASLETHWSSDNGTSGFGKGCFRIYWRSLEVGLHQRGPITGIRLDALMGTERGLRGELHRSLNSSKCFDIPRLNVLQGET